MKLKNYLKDVKMRNGKILNTNNKWDWTVATTSDENAMAFAGFLEAPNESQQ